MRRWATAGFAATTAVFVWATGALAESGWPNLARILASMPMAALWVASLAALVESFVGRRWRATPRWLGLLGVAVVCIAAIRVTGGI